jgi:tRNA threonylcarbamoyladenosine biosynthesis protein TsaE
VSRVVSAPTPDSLRLLAQDIGRSCTGGDVLVLSGDLGAGKTTFTQGLALGLGIDERVTSPTFVISRVHPHPGGGPALVHVDAYRLGSLGELEDLDLDADLQRSVVVVEWGRGLAESLSPEGLDVVITRSDDPEDDVRTVTIAARGDRWAGLLSDEGRWPT